MAVDGESLVGLPRLDKLTTAPADGAHSPKAPDRESRPCQVINSTVASLPKDLLQSRSIEDDGAACHHRTEKSQGSCIKLGVGQIVHELRTAPLSSDDAGIAQKSEMVSQGALELADMSAPIAMLQSMAQCTAPREGHRTASGRASCPSCGGRSSYSPSYYRPVVYASPASTYRGGGSSSGGGRASRTVRGTSISYTISAAEQRVLEPARAAIARGLQAAPARRDLFLCHAWDDRAGAAKSLHDELERLGVTVWFSEKDLGLGVPMLRAIDRGLANSHIGIVLVTPAFLRRIAAEGVADKELSVLLATGRVIPIVHETTFEALLDASPMLHSRSGLSTDESSLSNIAAEIADTVRREKDGI